MNTVRSATLVVLLGSLALTSCVYQDTSSQEVVLSGTFEESQTVRASQIVLCGKLHICPDVSLVLLADSFVLDNARVECHGELKLLAGCDELAPVRMNGSQIKVSYLRSSQPHTKRDGETFSVSPNIEMKTEPHLRLYLLRFCDGASPSDGFIKAVDGRVSLQSCKFESGFKCPLLVKARKSAKLSFRGVRTTSVGTEGGVQKLLDMPYTDDLYSKPVAGSDSLGRTVEFSYCGIRAQSISVNAERVRIDSSHLVLSEFVAGNDDVRITCHSVIEADRCVINVKNRLLIEQSVLDCGLLAVHSSDGTVVEESLVNFEEYGNSLRHDGDFDGFTLKLRKGLYSVFAAPSRQLRGVVNGLEPHSLTNCVLCPVGCSNEDKFRINLRRLEHCSVYVTAPMKHLELSDCSPDFYSNLIAFPLYREAKRTVGVFGVPRGAEYNFEFKTDISPRPKTWQEVLSYLPADDQTQLLIEETAELHELAVNGKTVECLIKWLVELRNMCARLSSWRGWRDGRYIHMSGITLEESFRDVLSRTPEPQ